MDPLQFRRFQAGPDPFGRTWEVELRWLQTAISIRHADSVDVKFIARPASEPWQEKVIALPHPLLLELCRQAGRALTDAWCMTLAARHLQYMVSSGEDLEKTLVTLSYPALQRAAGPSLRLPGNSTNANMSDRLWTTWKKTAEPQDTAPVLLEEYRDHGNWARHYSTVRMTLGTFFLTAATGMISVRWDQPRISTAIIAGILATVGFVLFLVFSWHTYKEKNDQLRIAREYRRALGGAPLEFDYHRRLGHADALPLGLIIWSLFLIFDASWYFLTRAQPGSMREFTVPVTVEVGQERVEIPVKVKMPDPAGRAK